MKIRLLLRLLWVCLVGLGSRGTGDSAFAQSPSSGAANRKIQPNDIIFIRVVGEPDLTMERRVSADGTISYPWLEDITVTDKTTGDVEKLLREQLHPDYIINPQVTVDFKEYVKQFVNVTGQVNKPGPVEIPVDRKLDLLEVLSRAGDLRPAANTKKIELHRKGDPVRTFDYQKLQSTVDPTKKFYVEPDDNVYVHERII
jgi:protein involved in polysaccharide export with SLBB domain